MIATAAAALASATTAAEVFDVIQHTTVVYDAARISARLERARDAHAEIIVACHRAQADALEIEAQAQCKLADEYDAAQQRGEVRSIRLAILEIVSNRNDLPRTAAEVGLSRKIVHEARKVRDAERENPGIIGRTVREQLSKGEAPTRADINRAITPPPRTVAAAPPSPAPRVATPEPAVPATPQPDADDDDSLDPDSHYWDNNCMFCAQHKETIVDATDITGRHADHYGDNIELPRICDECARRCIQIIERRRSQGGTP